MVQINSIKRIVTVSMAIIGFMVANAAVTFKFDARSNVPATVKSAMENNISSLLTEINRAATGNTVLNLAGINMEPAAKSRLEALWGDAPFVCDNTMNISSCLNDYQGYQVRKISITMKPKDSSYEQSLNRRLTISLNKQGVITGARLAWEIHEDVDQMLGHSNGVADTRKRMEILKWVEDFRCYYNERNLNALDQVYSEDALIITGSVVKRRKMYGDNDVHLENKVEYLVQSKTDYINKLKRIFRNNRRINVEFDHISVMMHNAKENIYGVTLHQKWQTSNYSDDGWLFLLWDFNDPEHPQIHVRTWQPEQIAATDGVFTLDDFFIP
ncbi:MAG: nuclear transport factor 2 family protein [Bacteroidales bacterium]|nr:nuclear transport factor 2 family protein [Bacteroidales bacterium]